MGRCRFVQPGTVRLFLVDVHKRAHEELTTKGIAVGPKADEKWRKATNAEIAASAQRVAVAEEDGAWIIVKSELTAGDSRRVFSRLVKTMHFDAKAEIDPEQVGLSKVVEYLLDWSFTDAQGETVPVSEAAICNLDAETFGEIVAAVDAHEEAGDKLREALKNAKAGTTKSQATSPSVG